jgi:hypothetical protein
MDPTDAFFTQTVVGAPFTTLLGRRRVPGQSGTEGLNVHLSSGEHRLSQLWQDWIVLSHATDPVGMPRPRPGKWRSLLERHALWLAFLGLASLLAAMVLGGVMLWR